MFYVQDADEGMIEIGFRELDTATQKYVSKGTPLSVPIDAAGALAEALQFFSSR